MPLFLFLLATLSAAIAPLESKAAQLPTQPEQVIGFLEQVFDGRDLNSYSALLASDYTFGTPSSPNAWDKNTQIKGMTALFAKPDVHLTFAREFTIRQDGAPETWVIDGLVGTIVVGELSTSSSATLHLRRNPTTRTIEITRWIGPDSGADEK